MSPNRCTQAMTVALVALLISIFAVPGPWAQTVRVLRRDSIDGLSTGFLKLNAWSACVWTAYGIADRDILQVFVNSSTAIASVLILIWACHNRAMTSSSTLKATVTFLTLVICLAVWGAQPVSVLAIAISIGSRFPQLLKAFKEPGGIAISLSSLAIAGTASVSWVAYGILQHDSAVLTTAAFNVFFCGFVVARTMQGRRYEQLKLQPA